MKKCNYKNTFVNPYFLLKVSSWLILVTTHTNLIEGSHIPANYLKDTIQKAQEVSRTTLPAEASIDLSSSETNSVPGGGEEIDEYGTSAGTTAFLIKETHVSSLPSSVKPTSSFAPTTNIPKNSASSATPPTNTPTQKQKHKVIKQDDEVSTLRSNPTFSLSGEVGKVIKTGRNPEEKSQVWSNMLKNPVQAQGQKGDEEVKNLISFDGKKYQTIEASCDEKRMRISPSFVSKFKGRIYAYGYPDESECGFRANTNNLNLQGNVTFNLPLGECGVQMLPIDPELEDIKRHEVTLYIQYSSFLQQIVDDKVTVTCVEIKKIPLEDAIQSSEINEPSSSRKGRRMSPPSPIKGGQTKISSKIGESWMEILAGKDPSPKSKKSSPVAVGQDVTLVISTKVMRGYDARIVNCSANDGSRLGSIDGYRSQQILDSAGCSVDTALVPNFRRRRLPIESRNRMITLHFATFPAFKFPERDHLHVKCLVAYCQGPCPQEPCDSGINHFGTWREKYGRIADALIDTTEIVNSVEVNAPELEETTGGGHYYERHQSTDPALHSSSPNGGGGSATDLSSRQFSDSLGRSNNNGNSHSSSTSMETMSNNGNPLVQQPSFVNGGNVCVSPGSVILALVILGVVLVISATATLWFALKRSEQKKYRQTVKHTPFQQHGPQPYYRFSHW